MAERVEEILGYAEDLPPLGGMTQAALALQVIEALHPIMFVAPVLARCKIPTASQVLEHVFVVLEATGASKQRAF
jgi:hypothetical protein